MNLYQYLTKHRDQINVLIKFGVVGGSVVRKMAIYKYYHDYLADGQNKGVARELTLQYFQISERYFYKVLDTMTATISAVD